MAQRYGRDERNYEHHGESDDNRRFEARSRGQYGQHDREQRGQQMQRPDRGQRYGNEQDNRRNFSGHDQDFGHQERGRGSDRSWDRNRPYGEQSPQSYANRNYGSGTQGYGHQGYGQQGYGSSIHGDSTYGNQTYGSSWNRGGGYDESRGWNRNEDEWRNGPSGRAGGQSHGGGYSSHGERSYAERSGHGGGYSERGRSSDSDTEHGNRDFGGGWNLGSNQDQWYGGHAGKGPKNYTRSDDRIREDVCDRLSQDDEVDASDITVTVHGGEVTLDGTVTDRRTKHRAEDIADAVSGVHDVHNNLRARKGALQEIGDKLMGREEPQHGHSGSGTRNTTGTMSTTSTSRNGS